MASETRSVAEDLLDAIGRLAKRDDMSAEYRRDVPILISALRLARDRATHGHEDEKPWRFCPWCGTPTGLHLGDPTMNCGRQDPIASAVRAELQPLEDALIDVGHKLVKDGEATNCMGCNRGWPRMASPSGMNYWHTDPSSLTGSEYLCIARLEVDCGD